MFNWLVKLFGGIPKEKYEALLKEYKKQKNILELYLKGNICAKSGNVPIDNGVLDIIFPKSVKSVYIDTYRLNNTPVRIKVDVTPGKEYHISSKHYTEDVTKRHMILINTDDVLFREGRVHEGSSTYVPHPANIVWNNENDD